MPAIPSLDTARQNQRSILAMTLAMAAFSSNDMFVKLAGETLPVSQILALRGVLATAALGFVLYATRGRARLDLMWHPAVFGRAIMEVIAAAFFLTALMRMPFANITAILQALPFIITLLAIVFLKEQVGWRRWSAIAIGFAGMLMIVRPGAEGFNAASLIAVAGVLFFAFRDFTARFMPPEIPSLTAALLTSLAVTVFGFVWGAFEEWVWPTARATAFILAATVFIVAGYVLIIVAARSGDVGAVAPFRYTAMPIALLYGFIIWGDWPDAIAMLGITLIVGSGIYVYVREHRLSHASRNTKT